MVLLLLESKADLEHDGVGGLVCHEPAFLSLHCFICRSILLGY